MPWAGNASTIIESSSREALRSNGEERGYQLMLAVWAETNVVVADEYHDGNVPAILDPLSLVKRCFSALPETVSTFSIAATRRATSVTWSTGCGMRSGRMDHADR